MAGEYVCEVPDKVWVYTLKYIISNIDTFAFNPNDIHMLWVVNGGHIRGRVSNDQLVLSWLKLTLPKYTGGELELYRGECKFLYDQGLIGFCWTPKMEVAEKFAMGLNAIESGGVLLKTKIGPEAILSAPNIHSKDLLGESEFTCDPTKLGQVEVLKSYKKYSK
ncbi:MAG: hypothetical protein ABJK64_19175 [Paraglaciecola sp.]|uniref:hypothetical protein n=1 Tax=Paraglaciecola sp. TaxID=1920173 RepID=UPI003296B5F8